MPLGFDCILLQSHLSIDEEISINDIAARVFCEEGKLPGKVAQSRAQQAAQRLVVLNLATPLYQVVQEPAGQDKKVMTHIRSRASCGGQLSALMYLSVRRAILGRKAEHEEKNETQHETEKGIMWDTSCPG